VIFSRRRGNAGRQDGGANGAGKPDPATERSSDLDGEDSPQLPEFGPYDVSQAPRDRQERLDLGALKIPAVPGVEIHLQTGPQGQIQQIQLAHGDSRLSLSVFAAPRTEGIWEEVRESLRTALVDGGAQPEQTVGDYGPELRARVRDTSGGTDVRHVGIDGPRWFVHGVFLGGAAFSPDQDEPLRDVLRGLVVDRGTEARPVSEALPLQLPPEAAAQLAEASADTSADTSSDASEQADATERKAT
jgi:hypothetical protein